MTRKCEHCESENSRHTRFGVWLCETCRAGMETIERERIEEEKNKVNRLVENKPDWQPSLALILYLGQIRKAATIPISSEKITDFHNTNIVPLVHLLTDSELERMVAVLKDEYFYVQATLSMRSTDRFREAEVIKRQQKVEKTREKATKEIAKQKKYASKDKTLSKEERAKARIIEGLMAIGLSESDAIATVLTTLK